MAALLHPRLVHEVLVRAERFQSRSKLRPDDEKGPEELVRLTLQVPAKDLPLLGHHLSQAMSWLLLYHPETPAALLPWALAGFPHQDVTTRYEIRAKIAPDCLEQVDDCLRAVVLGRLMLAVLNGQLPLTALPPAEALHAYLDAWGIVSLRPTEAALWDALYVLAHAIDLWRQTGFHPRQWECQTIIASLPSTEPARLLAYAATIATWVKGDSARDGFASQWWGATLKYLGADVRDMTLPLGELCRFMEQAAQLRPPFLAVAEPDPAVLDCIIVTDFDPLFQEVARSWPSRLL